MFEGASGHQNALFLLRTGGDLGLPVSLRSPTDPVFIENTRFRAAVRRRGLGREEFYIGAGHHVRREIGVYSTVWALHHHKFRVVGRYCCGWIQVLDAQHSLSVSTLSSCAPSNAEVLPGEDQRTGVDWSLSLAIGCG